MKRKFWNSHVLLRLLLPFIFGIIIGKYIFVSHESLLMLLFGCSLLAITLVSLSYLQVKFSWISGALVYTLFILLGFCRAQQQHISTPQPLEYERAEKSSFLVQLIADPLSTAKSYRLETQIKAHDDGEWVGQKVVIYFAKTIETTPKNGDFLFLNHFINEVAPPKNPHEFSFKKYMAKQGIFYQTYVNENTAMEIYPGNRKSNFIEMLREAGSKYVDTYISEQNQGIAKALLFGLRNDLTREQKSDFIDAGTMHILAVSGLHVGIIFLLISSFIKTINHRIPIPKSLQLLVVLTVIWIFVLLTGAKASVLRAGIMFSVFAVGMSYFPKMQSLNTLACAAIFILAINPNHVFDVGFQLSFSAVAGILMLVPVLRQIFPVPKFLIPKYLLDITYVSIAAQLATLPFSLYYFQQFPSFGLLTNLVAIPLAIGIVAVGFVGFIFSAIPFLAETTGFLLDWMIRILGFINSYVAELPTSTISSIHLTEFESLLLFLGVALLGLMFFIENKKLLIISLTSFLILSISLGVNKWTISNQTDVTVYQINNNIVIEVQHGRSVDLFTKDPLTNQQEKYHLLPNHKANYIRSKNFYSFDVVKLGETYHYENGTFALPSRTLQYSQATTNPSGDIVLFNDLDYKELYHAKQAAESKQVIIANTYPNRSVPDSLENLHFLVTEGYFQLQIEE